MYRTNDIIIGLGIALVTLLLGPLFAGDYRAYFFVAGGAIFVGFFVGVFFSRQQLNNLESQIIGKDAKIEALVSKTTKLDNQISELQLDLASSRAVLDSAEIKGTGNFDRFEKLGPIRASYVTYEPLLSWKHGKPVGFGLRFLSNALDNRLVLAKDKLEWGSVVDELVNDRADIILTPLFETFDRRSKVTFTSPLFYADIGCFVPQSVANAFNLKNLSFVELVEKLRAMKSIRFHAIEGELSSKMARKFSKLIDRDPNGIKFRKGVNADVPGLLRELSEVGSGNGGAVDVVFCETIQALFVSDEVTENIVNVLHEKEFLYPVAFAMQKNNHILRNYLNLIILEAQSNGTDRVFELLKSALHEDYPNMFLDNDISRFFVREKFGFPAVRSTNEKRIG